MKAIVTDFLRCFIDDFIPGFLRDNKVFMGFIFHLVYRNRAKYIMNFKNIAIYLTENEFENYYNMFPNIRRATDLNDKSIQKILNSIVGESVLDAGCGRGFLTEIISKNKNLNVVGIDIKIPNSLQNTKNLSFIKCNIEKMPFDNDQFDTVICTHTLEHVIHLFKTIAELRRVAKRRLIIVVPRERPYKYTFNLHLNFFPYPNVLQNLMGNAGIECCLLDGEIFYSEDIILNT